jgi:hypothetical protein
MPSATAQARKILINLIEYVKSIDLPFELFSQIIHTCFLRHALMLRTAYGLHVFAGLQEKFENTKLVIRIRTPKKDTYYGQKKKGKRTNNDL